MFVYLPCKDIGLLDLKVPEIILQFTIFSINSSFFMTESITFDRKFIISFVDMH